jgi:hypothetical protein
MLFTGKINQAFTDENHFFIGEFCKKEFGVDLGDDDLKSIVQMAQDSLILERTHPSGGWSDESWRSWIKNRLSNHFIPGFDSSCVTWVTARLNIFFIHIEENEEMLVLLRQWNEPEKDFSVAVSKIFDEAGRVPTPIDRTANRVAKPPKNKKVKS